MQMKQRDSPTQKQSERQNNLEVPGLCESYRNSPSVSVLNESEGLKCNLAQQSGRRRIRDSFPDGSRLVLKLYLAKQDANQTLGRRKAKKKILSGSHQPLLLPLPLFFPPSRPIQATR
ncbi:unnamed protein product [Pleuronectes platessa]|uniref:Uncharacterized protein n=1 Tax=Pleuronectes platessa TaxID=8262 RepID=A0A9N7Y6I5_PLEPL|nr:unnamed protein product [Pleuronectes platessa]